MCLATPFNSAALFDNKPVTDPFFQGVVHHKLGGLTYAVSPIL